MASNKPHRRKRHNANGVASSEASSSGGGRRSSSKTYHHRGSKSTSSAWNGSTASWSRVGRKVANEKGKRSGAQSVSEPKRRPLLSIPLISMEPQMMQNEGKEALVQGEGILSHLNRNLGYIYSTEHGSVYFHQGDVDERLKRTNGQKQEKKLPEIFDLGARVIFRAERQPPKNGCIYKATWVSLLEHWHSNDQANDETNQQPRSSVYHGRLEQISDVPFLSNGLGTSIGRRYSLPASAYGLDTDPGGQPAEVTVSVGVITNAFEEGYGFVWCETLGRVYFTKDSYCKKFPRMCNLFGSDDVPPGLKQSVKFEAVPQKEFAPSCSWRAISIRPFSQFVAAPSVRRAVCEVATVTRTYGTLKTKKMELKIFFTLSDYHVHVSRSHYLTDVMKEGEVMVVGFVPQKENNGYLYRAIHVAPYTREEQEKEASIAARKRARNNPRVQSPVLIDDKSYSQVVKEGKETPVPIVAASSDAEKPLNLKLLHSMFPPWVDEPENSSENERKQPAISEMLPSERKPRTQSLCSTFDPFFRFGGSLNMTAGSLRNVFCGNSEAELFLNGIGRGDEFSSDTSTPPGLGCVSLDEGLGFQQSLLDRDSVETGSSLAPPAMGVALPFEIPEQPQIVDTVESDGNSPSLELENLRKTLGSLAIKISDSERAKINENAELINHADTALSSADSGLADTGNELSVDGEYERHSKNVEKLVGEPFLKMENSNSFPASSKLNKSAAPFQPRVSSQSSPVARPILCVPQESLGTPPMKQTPHALLHMVPTSSVGPTWTPLQPESPLLSPGATAAANAVHQKISRHPRPPPVSKLNNVPNFIPYRQHIIATPPNGGPPVIIPFQPPAAATAAHFQGLHMPGGPLVYHPQTLATTTFIPRTAAQFVTGSPRHTMDGSPSAGLHSPGLQARLHSPGQAPPTRILVQRSTQTEPVNVKCGNCRATTCLFEGKRK